MFTLSALDYWADYEADLPLTYAFGYLKANGESAYLGIESLENELTTYLPAGDPKANYNLSLFVDVYDTKRAVSRALHTVRVTPLANITTESLKSFAAKIQVAFAANDLSSVIGQIMSTVDVLNDASHSGI